ncbi:hypothetical protein [Kitasatospora sp. NPDC127116]|uniref:hypothetical protein n=1 Tax=Kitasatospora sp. NPDC127116 TaxID=3345367 RepID=UPI003631306B
MTAIDKILGEPARLILRHPDGRDPLYKPVHTYGNVTDGEVRAFAEQYLHLPAGQVDVYRVQAV